MKPDGDITKEAHANLRILTHCALWLVALQLTAAETVPTVTAAEAWQRGWPNISGPMGNFQGLASDTELLDNLSLATLKWTSETDQLGAGKGGGVKRNNRKTYSIVLVKTAFVGQVPSVAR